MSEHRERRDPGMTRPRKVFSAEKVAHWKKTARKRLRDDGDGLYGLPVDWAERRVLDLARSHETLRARAMLLSNALHRIVELTVSPHKKPMGAFMKCQDMAYKVLVAQETK